MEENEKPDFGTRGTGMYVPEGFFAEFQKELESKIDQKVQRHITMRRWSIAASIALILGLAPLAYSLLSNETEAEASNEIYAEAPVEDMSTEDIMVSTISDLDIYENFYADL